MLRKVAFCIGCLAVRGLAFTPSVRPSHAVFGRGRPGSTTGTGVFHAGLPDNGGRVPPHCRPRAAREAEDTQDNPVVDEVASRSTAAENAAAAAMRALDEVVADSLFRGSIEQRPPRSMQKLLAGALACSLLLASPLTATRSAHADSSPPQQQQQQLQLQLQPQQQQLQQQQLKQQQQYQQPQRFGMVAPRLKHARPPPNIPPGRITLVQWFDKNIGRYVPTLEDVTAGVKTAAETSEKIRFKSGSSPTTQDLRRMTGEALEGKLGGLFAARRSSSAAVVQELGATPDKPSMSSVPPPETSIARQEIDALKAEMLRLQPTSPSAASTTPVAPSQTASAGTNAAPSRRGDPPPLSSPFAVPSTPPSWFSKIDMSTITPTVERRAGDKLETSLIDIAAQTQKGATGGERPAAGEAEAPRSSSKGKRREKPRRNEPVSVAVVDLKAELRAESEKAAANAPSPSSQERARQGRQRQRQKALAPGSTAAQYVVPAPIYEPSKAAPTTRESVGDASDTGRDMMAVSDTSPNKLNSGSVAGQVKDLDEKGGDSEAAMTAALEQGRATVDRLQAEANRIFADAGSTTAPITDKLAAGVSTLPEAGRSAGQSAGSRFSQLSGSVVSKLSGSARNAAVQIGSVKDDVKDATGGLGATLAGSLSETVGSGAGKFLPSVGEAGRKVTEGVSTLSQTAADGLPVVRDRASALSSQIGSAAGGAGKALNDGVSKLSKKAADGLPVVQDQVSILTSQVAGKSGQAVSQASETVGKISGTISGRISGVLSGVSSRGPDLAAQATGTLAKLLGIGGSFANAAVVAAQKAVSTIRETPAGRYFADGVGGGTGGAGAAVAAGVVVVIAAGAVTAGSGNEDGAGEEAEAIGASGSPRAGAAVEDEAERLQPIGGGAASGEVVMEGEGQLLQPVGVKLETGAANNGERFGEEAMSATSTLWDMIRESGTGAGDAVREVSEEDLLERAALVGRELRETAEGLAVLKHEVSALRESIRESDLEGKARALRERLASILEGSIAE